MRKQLILFISAFTFLYSCESDDNKVSAINYTNTMSAVINNMPYNLDQSVLDNDAIHNPEEYLLIKAWAVNAGGGANTIDIYLNKSNIQPGIYAVKTIVSPEGIHYIYFEDNTNNEAENTVSGEIEIISSEFQGGEVKSIKGNFSFTTSNNTSDNNPVINYTIQDGKFDYTF